MSKILRSVLGTCFIFASAATLQSTAATAEEHPLLENPAITDEEIDRYCASIDSDARNQCYRDIIAPLASASSRQARQLLARALRELREWTEDKPELADLRRREQAVYREILRRDPYDSEIRYFLATSQEKEADTNELLRQLLDDEPGHVAAAWVLSTNTLHNGTNEDLPEIVTRLRTAYEHAGQPDNLILASEMLAALTRLDEETKVARFRHEVRRDYGVFTSLERASSVVGSNASVADKILAAKDPMDQYCFSPYLHFDTDICRQAVALMIDVEESAPGNPDVLRASIAGMQILRRPGFGAANDYSDELEGRLERLIALEGPSTALLFDYAAVLEGQEQIDVLESIIADDPASPAEVHALLARALFNSCDYEPGLEQMRTAFDRSEGREKANYAAELVQALRVYGTPQDVSEADRIEKMLPK